MVWIRRKFGAIKEEGKSKQLVPFSRHSLSTCCVASSVLSTQTVKTKMIKMQSLPLRSL